MNADPKGMARVLRDEVANILLSAAPRNDVRHYRDALDNALNSIAQVAATLENVIEPSGERDDAAVLQYEVREYLRYLQIIAEMVGLDTSVPPTEGANEVVDAVSAFIEGARPFSDGRTIEEARERCGANWLEEARQRETPEWSLHSRACDAYYAVLNSAPPVAPSPEGANTEGPSEGPVEQTAVYRHFTRRAT